MQDGRTQAARRHFDGWSKTYERDRTSQRFKQAQDAAIAALDLRPDDAFLDVACGTGAAVRSAAATVRRAAGFDLSPAMIARARALAEGLHNVEFYEGDIAQGLPFADGEFSAILCTSAFHHFTKQADALGEMARVMARGGRLVIADANADELVVRLLDLLLRVFQRSHVRFRRPSQLASDMQALGVPDTSVSTMWRGGYAVIRAQKQG